MKKYTLISLMLVVMVLTVVLSACGKKEASDQPAEASTSIQNADPENLDDITMDALVDEAMKQMTLEQKIGQLFIVCTDSLDFNAETEMTDEMKTNLEKYQPGGVILFSFNLDHREQTTEFIQDMKETTKIPMFISVDEEGGNVARIANTDGMGTTKFPSMATIGETGDPSQAYTVGDTVGREISELGFNLDFAPVADLSTNEDNTEIGERSFGSDPDLVSQMVSQEVKGLQNNGVSAALKHFPGQGNAGEDTHKGYVNLDVTIDGLRDNEFLPFEEGIAAGADMIMMSHVSVKGITQSDIPASLSSLMVNDILREELQYDGIIITDAMNMKIITKFYEAGQAAVSAIKAGNDMILMPDNFESAYEAVSEAVEEGTLSEKRINASVRRILEVKIRRGILPLNSSILEKITQAE
ncbi:MAG: glycoside hydrolase family 3 protein [Lachnospiraceae bacterium]|nr:glycoside hydrolase family 3 protein [Lachnospiraceae bacterium]